MKSSTLRKVQGVAVFLVFLALLITVYHFRGGKGQHSVDLKKPQSEFQKRNWLNKISFELSSGDLKASLDKMNQLLDSYSLRTDMRDIKGNYGVFVFSLEKSRLNALRNELSKIGSIGSELEVVDTSLVNTNVEIESANLASYEKDLAELDKIRVPSDAELRRKESLRDQIRRSQQKLDDLRRSDSFLVYVSLVPSGKQTSTIRSVGDMAIYYLTVLGFLFVTSILIYYGTRLLMYLLALMGFKGITGKGGMFSPYQYGGYSSYSGRYYSSKGYGRSSKRKVKRIYKDKATTPREGEEKPEE
ncbi:MAG TPA: hypothetical protein PL126_00770 [Candidatus Cloacimonadota bacterium]|nr:hypothetical protein [Candidatus Cloacimonadota bacterium]